MMTVKQVSRLTGVSVRALQYYDKIGLLIPAGYSRSGYRLYDDTALEKLQQILIYRELEFPLKEIKRMLNRPDFDRKKALEQQIALLEMKKEHIENLIAFAKGIKMIGVKAVNFSVFDKTRLDEYSHRAKEEWGNTDVYKELAEKEKNRTYEDNERLIEEMMTIFAEFGEMKHSSPVSDEAQAQVKKLKDFITENAYTCTDNMLMLLSRIYSGGGEITDNIDEVGGNGTAAFAAEAIRHFCSANAESEKTV